MEKEIHKDRIETLYETRFLKLYDLQYEEEKHYFEASRREKEDLVVRLPGTEFREILPDAVTIAVVLHLPENETQYLKYSFDPTSYDVTYGSRQYNTISVSIIDDYYASLALEDRD